MKNLLISLLFISLYVLVESDEECPEGTTNCFYNYGGLVCCNATQTCFTGYHSTICCNPGETACCGINPFIYGGCKCIDQVNQQCCENLYNTVCQANETCCGDINGAMICCSQGETCNNGSCVPEVPLQCGNGFCEIGYQCCNDQCYTTEDYTCYNNFLCSKDDGVCEGNVCYDPNYAVCFPGPCFGATISGDATGDVLCGKDLGSCGYGQGAICYNPLIYICTDVNPPQISLRPTNIPCGTTECASPSQCCSGNQTSQCFNPTNSVCVSDPLGNGEVAVCGFTSVGKAMEGCQVSESQVQCYNPDTTFCCHQDSEIGVPYFRTDKLSCPNNEQCNGF